MPTRRISFDNATPGTRLFGRDKSRVCFAVHVDSTFDSVAIQDGEFTPGGSATINLDPGDTLFVSALDGHDVTKPWFIISNTTGTDEAYIYEEFLDESIMEKLRAKGIETTQGLPFLILAALAVGSQ